MSKQATTELEQIRSFVATGYGADFDEYIEAARWFTTAGGHFHFTPPSGAGFFAVELRNEDFIHGVWFDNDGTDHPLSDDDLYDLERAVRFLAVPARHPRV